jgi:ABC-2 type transport system permease protein
MLAKRAFLALLLLCWTPFLVRAVTIYASYAAATIPQASFFRPTPETFRAMLGPDGIEGLFIFLVTVYVGAGLIANDRRANALQIYLSKPLTRAEYVCGKLAVLAVFLLLVTWLPTIVLLLVQMTFAGNFTFLANNVYLFPAITVYSAIEVLLVSMTMLALSSLSKSSRYVAILYAAVLFFTSAMYGVLRVVTHSTALSWISFSANLSQVGNGIFRLPLPYQTPWIVSLLIIAACIGASAMVLERRVRGIEVVK